MSIHVEILVTGPVERAGMQTLLSMYMYLHSSFNSVLSRPCVSENIGRRSHDHEKKHDSHVNYLGCGLDVLISKNLFSNGVCFEESSWQDCNICHVYVKQYLEKFSFVEALYNKCAWHRCLFDISSIILVHLRVGFVDPRNGRVECGLPHVHVHVQ